MVPGLGPYTAANNMDPPNSLNAMRPSMSSLTVSCTRIALDAHVAATHAPTYAVRWALGPNQLHPSCVPAQPSATAAGHCCNTPEECADVSHRGHKDLPPSGCSDRPFLAECVWARAIGGRPPLVDLAMPRLCLMACGSGEAVVEVLVCRCCVFFWVQTTPCVYTLHQRCVGIGRRAKACARTEPMCASLMSANVQENRLGKTMVICVCLPRGTANGRSWLPKPEQPP